MTFPEDPRGLTRDELVRRALGRRRRLTRSAFVRALVEARERPPARNVEATVRVFLHGAPVGTWTPTRATDDVD